MLIRVPGPFRILFRISGTSKILSKSEPAYLLTITKITQTNKNNYGIILKPIIFHIQTFWNFEHVSNLDPPDSIFLIFVVGIPPNKRLVSISVFGRLFPEHVLTHYFGKMQNHKQILMNQTSFSKSHVLFVQGIYGNQIFVFFSPRTFLVSMEKTLFELLGFPKK